MFKRDSWPIFVAVALTAAALAVAPAMAGRKNSNTPCASPTLTGLVNAGTYTTNGCGFEPGQMVALNVGEADGCCMAFNTVADESGRFTYSGRVSAPGTYSVKAATQWRGGWRFVAEWSFESY